MPSFGADRRDGLFVRLEAPSRSRPHRGDVGPLILGQAWPYPPGVRTNRADGFVIDATFSTRRWGHVGGTSTSVALRDLV
jgi:hypothetical protein